MAKKMALLAGLALSLSVARSARADDDAFRGAPAAGRWEFSYMMLYGTQRPQPNADPVQTRSSAGRLGFFLSRNWEIGGGYEHVTAPFRRNSIQPFVQYHIVTASRLVPYFGLEGDLPVKAENTLVGGGLNVGIKYFSERGLVPFIEARVQARSTSTVTSLRTVVAGGLSFLF